MDGCAELLPNNPVLGFAVLAEFAPKEKPSDAAPGLADALGAAAALWEAPVPNDDVLLAPNIDRLRVVDYLP